MHDLLLSSLSLILLLLLPTIYATTLHLHSLLNVVINSIRFEFFRICRGYLLNIEIDKFGFYYSSIRLKGSNWNILLLLLLLTHSLTLSLPEWIRSIESVRRLLFSLRVCVCVGWVIISLYFLSLSLSLSHKKVNGSRNMFVVVWIKWANKNLSCRGPSIHPPHSFICLMFRFFYIFGLSKIAT